MTVTTSCTTPPPLPVCYSCDRAITPNGHCGC